MLITKRAVGLVAGALTCVMTLAVGGAVAFAAVPPFDPDPDAYGTITFFDAAGNVVTSGINAAESPKYAVASTNPTDTVLNKRANLALFNPQAGQPTGNWNGTQMNTNTVYPLSTAPASVSSSTFPATTQLPTSQSFAAIAATFVPNTGALANVFQVRLRSVQIRDYASASITIDPATGAWQQIFPEPGAPPITVPPTAPPATEPVVDPTVPVVDPTVPVVDPTVPVVDPTVPVVDPTVPVVDETVQPTIEPTATVSPTQDSSVLGTNISGSGSGTSSTDLVSSPSDSGGPLARTGSEVLTLVGIALLLLVLGAAALVGSRRIRPAPGKHV